MRQPTPTDALRLLLIASLGLPAYACGTDNSNDGRNPAPGDGDGDGDGDAGTGGSGGGGVGPGVLGACTNPTPFFVGRDALVASGEAIPTGLDDTGFVRCDEGYLQREEVKSCPSVLPRPAPPPSAGGAGGASEPGDEIPQGPPNECESDTDCGGPLEYCEMVGGGGEAESYKACLSSCGSDADCDDGAVCLCGEEFGTCVSSYTGFDRDCRTDDDCAGEAACIGVVNPGACGPEWYQFTCQTEEDECSRGSDCPIGWCSTQQSGLTCESAPICGRPFLVEQEDRKAQSESRADWCATFDADAEGVSCTDEERKRAASYFERIALMEHASIAAFARFSLQLLSLGAPAELIEATNRALVDETKHARLAFALASRFGGQPMGPGRLDIAHSLDGDAPEAILTTTILEGCIGETMAALEARAALAVCEDEQVRAVLEQIAEDESRHAQLAWQVVQWMLVERPELRGVAARVFEEALAPSLAVGDQPGAEALGVLGGQALARVAEEARTQVVAPCAKMMLDSLLERAETDRASTGNTDKLCFEDAVQSSRSPHCYS